eukprot:GEMP01031951.1.p1 GENE.GEMP01031951.1~~GEMP01031951.1.p1  ORF type:complete len:399 (+),score=84.51 GEMP01031951.1:141-1199(+)
MVALLRIFRTVPSGQKMDPFGESAIQYGHEMLQANLNNTSMNVTEAYPLFLLADVSSSKVWQFDNAPLHATTRQKFWHALQLEQDRRTARCGTHLSRADRMKHLLAFLRPLYTHVCTLFRATKGTPMDATVGRRFHTRPIELFVDAVEARLRECDVAKQLCQQHDLKEDAAKSGIQQDMMKFYNKREKLKREWETTVKTVDVSEILDMAQGFLCTFVEIEAPEVLDAILDGLKAIIKKKTWNDEHISKVLERVRQKTDGSLENLQTRCGIFIAQCFTNRAGAESGLWVPVGGNAESRLQEMRSTEFLSEYLLGKIQLKAGVVYRWPYRAKEVHEQGSKERKLQNQENKAPKN